MAPASAPAQPLPEHPVVAPPPTPLLTPPPRPPRRTPLNVNLAVTLPVTIGTGLIAIGTELIKGELSGPWCGLSCSIDELNALDRRVVGNRNPSAAKASDVLLYSTVALPFVADFIDTLGSGAAARTGPGWQRDALKNYGEGALVLLETLAVNLATTGVVKLAVRRPRPLVYDAAVPDDERREPDSALSFFSGHSSTTFAMATAYSTLLTLRHPDLPGLYVPIWVASEGIALSTALLRVEAGKHFYTDILTGALVGAAIGVAVPLLHRRTAQLRIDGQALRLTPLVFPGGGGLALISRNR